MRRKLKSLAIHRRKSPSVSKETGPLCWGLTFLFVAGINIATFSLFTTEYSSTSSDQSYQPEFIIQNSSDVSDFHETADRQHRSNHDILPSKLPPEPDATTAEKGVLWRYRLPDGVEFSLMQMPTIHAVAAGTRYTAAHRCSLARFTPARALAHARTDQQNP
jgi:hypothetical protein